ncbi:MAG: 6,7-dimethyl-8-ribityllumazine synthase [Tepidisphaeraceae bacterium]
MSNKPPVARAWKIPKSAKIAVIAARFNERIVDELLRRCLARLGELGFHSSKIEIHRVPGAFELPLAAKWAGQMRGCSAVICLGAVIRGQTPHFDFVAGAAARGIQRVAIDLGIPVIFGVLTTNNERQARQRIGAGKRAAEAAVEMLMLKNRFRKKSQ